MGDDDYLDELMGNVEDRWSYHEICKWLPHKPETIADIANDMRANGYRHDRPIIVYEGSILDGRHRYEAALEAGVDPIFVEFHGTREEAINYVTSENVNRRMLNNQEKEYFYVQRAEALGVRNHGDRSNDRSLPTQAEHANALGVGEATIRRWESTRKEIKADPELAKKSKIFEGFVEAKKEIKDRRKIVEENKKRAPEDYRVRQGQEVIKLSLDDVVTPIFSIVATWYREFDGKQTPTELAKEAWKKLSRNQDLRSPEQMAEELVRLKKFQQVYAEMIQNLDGIIEEAQPKLKLVK